MTYLSLVGDVCLDSPKSKLKLDPIFPSATNLVLGNLETPLPKDGTAKRTKAGPNIKGDINRLPVLQQHFPHWLFTVANNHAMDYGWEGLQHTQHQCDRVAFRCLGAGPNRDAAQAPIILEQDGLRLGLLARCETQFGVATPTSPGVAALDANIYKDIETLKKDCDLVILSIHGGAEICPWPSPKWQTYLRSFIDAGADIVHGHHTHVPQGYETYKHGFICYGLGNFLANPRLWSRHRHGTWSVVPTLKLENNQISYDIQTTVLEAVGPDIRLRPSQPEEFQRHQQYLDQCNAPLQNPALLESIWQEAAVKLYKSFYGDYLEFARPERKVKVKPIPLARKYLGRIKRQITNSPSQRQLLLWYHLFACETHHDVIATALGVLSGELDDQRNPQSQRIVAEMMPRLVV
jgi:poly-gamma-glutamate synthesis protein (capsule biosynthesis protein)